MAGILRQKLKTNRGIAHYADGGSVPDAGRQMRQAALNQAANMMYWDSDQSDPHPAPEGFWSSLGSSLNAINPVAIARGYVNHMNHPLETATGLPGGGFEDIPGVVQATKAIGQASSGNLAGAAGTAVGNGILAAAPYAGYKAYTRYTPGGYEFYSPNTSENTMNVDQAMAALESPEQQRLMQYGKDIDASLGHRSAPVNALGVWKHGVENSIFNTVYGRPTIDDLEYSVAKKGDFADQKSAATFAFNSDGPDMAYRVKIPGITKKDAQKLVNTSGMWGTTADTKDGAAVVFLDPGDQLADHVRQFAQTNHGQVTRKRGYARFPGADTREDAHGVYGQIFDKYENQ